MFEIIKEIVIPKITYYIFRKKYQEPTIDEGFKRSYIIKYYKEYKC